MQKIRNVIFKCEEIKTNDVFICAIGYEERSRFLLDKLQNNVCNVSA